MKSFLQFISEAETQASSQAKNMGLSGDGHGDWYDKQGKLVAKTVSGRLKFFGNRALGKKIEPQTLAQPKQETPKPEKNKEKKQLTVGFGRFNPPTVGHEKLMNAISKTAGKGGEYKIYPSRTQDSKKNPLNPSDKVEYMRKAFPDHANSIVDDDKTKTIFDVLKSAYGKGYSTVNVVVGSDRVKEFENLANKYNGQLYNFDKINIVSAGERSSDAKGVEGMSASKLRKAAMDGDYKTFRSGISKALDDKSAKKLFNTVQNSMKKTKSEAWEFAPNLHLKVSEKIILQKIYSALVIW